MTFKAGTHHVCGTDAAKDIVAKVCGSRNVDALKAAFVYDPFFEDREGNGVASGHERVEEVQK
jgi:hypothetical protein